MRREPAEHRNRVSKREATGRCLWVEVDVPEVVFPEGFVTCKALSGPFEPVVLLEDSEQSHTKGKAESQAVRKVLHSSSWTTSQVIDYL